MKRERQEENHCLEGYKLVEKLGRGTYGTVYQYSKIDNNKTYAIKVLRLVGRTPEEHKLAFEKEARLAKKFSETWNIGPKFVASCYGEDTGYIITEKWDADLKFEDELTPRVVAKLLQQIKVLHDHDYVHADIFPRNVLVRKVEDLIYDITLTDFGLTNTVSGLAKSESLVEAILWNHFKFPPYRAYYNAHKYFPNDVRNNLKLLDFPLVWFFENKKI